MLLLVLRGSKTFIDDDVNCRGLDINRTLSEKIEESRIAVIVFSKNYSDSTWCLNELVKIQDCREENGLIVYTVFYDVSASDVRNLTGDFGKAFSKHEDSKEVDLWRQTLDKIGAVAGWDLTNPVGS